MFKPPKRKVAIRPVFDSDKTPSGRLWVPDIAKERCDQGFIKYVGSNLKEDLKIGDYVLFSGHTGTLVKLEGEGLLIVMHEEYVTARIDNPPSNTPVPGLYHKAKGWGNLEKRLWEIADGINNPSADDILKIVIEENPYFESNYEDVMELVADAFQETDFKRNIRTNRHTSEKLSEIIDDES